MSDAAFIKEATEALLVEILDDDCDDLQSVRAIARTLRAALSAPSPLPAPLEPTDAQLHAAFDLDSGGPNPYYRCKSCGATEPGLREYLVAHYLRCKE